MKRINIIGAGPVGCYLAYLLSDYNVHVYEEHEEIGKPVQCTGIITSKINEIMKIPEKIIVNKVSRYKIKSKNNELNIKLKNPDLIVDREKFDKHIYNMAKNKGVKFHLGKKIKELDMEGVIIGADGPNSIVSKKIGNENDFFIGVQKVVKKSLDYIEVDLTKGKFSWIVPEGNGFCRIGMFGEKGIKMKDSTQGGLIPIYNTKEIFQKDNMYVVGDAASLVKATTGGGIVQGLKSAEILANCIIKNQDYRKKLKKLRRELWVHLFIRKQLDKLNDKQKDKLLDIASRQKDIIENVSRDNAIMMLIKLILREPRLLFIKLYK